MTLTDSAKRRLTDAVKSLAIQGLSWGLGLGPLGGILKGLTDAGVTEIGTEAAGDWLAKYGVAKVLDSPNATITNHLQRALKEALDQALDELASVYQNQHVLEDGQAEAIGEVVALLKSRSETEFMEEVRQGLSAAELQRYLTAAPQQVAPELTTRLNWPVFATAVAGYGVGDFLTFTESRLPERMQFWFREKLKTGTEAKQAMDLLYFQTIQDALDRLGTDQQSRKQEAERLLQMAERNHTQIEFYGKIWLSAIRQSRDKLDELLENDRHILQQMQDAGLDLREIKQLLQNRTATALAVNLPADEIYQQLLRQRSELEASLTTVQEKKHRVANQIDRVDEDIRETLQEQLNGYQTRELELSTKRSGLTKTLEQHVAGVLRLAESLGRNVGGSKRLQRARELFEQGKLAEVNDLLDIKAIRKDRDGAKSILHQLAQEIIVKARTLTLISTDPERFETAAEFYHEAVSTSSDAITCMAAGHFFHTQMQFAHALKYYEQAVGLYKNLIEKDKQYYLHDLAATLNNIGNVYSLIGRFEEAIKYIEEAISYYFQLDPEKQTTYLPYIAGILSSLGITYKKIGNFDMSWHHYQESLKIRRILCEIDRDTYLPDLASSLNNIGNLFMDKNLETAKEYYEEALAIRQQLALLDKKYISYLGATLNNLGNLYRFKGDFEKAIIYFKQSSTYYQEIGKNNSDAYRLEIAMNLGNMSLFFLEKNNYNEALDNAKQAINWALPLYGQAFEANDIVDYLRNEFSIK